jgi:imidazolonepropionase-like amidohydrolase
MKRMIAMSLPCLLLATLPAQQSPVARSVVLNHVTIINPTGAPRREMAVLISGNRIAAVDRVGRIRVPPDAQVLDASGKFLIPGLADMHNHLAIGFSIPGQPVPEGEAPRDFRRSLTQMLAWGFTTVFSTSHGNPDLRDFTTWRGTANEESAPLARYFGVGRAISVKAGHASQPHLASYLPDTPDEARGHVREMKTAGVDAIKLVYADQTHTGRAPLPVMRPEVMRAIIDEAHKVGLKAYVHAPTLRHAKEVLEAGADGLVHSVADMPVDDEFIAMMKKNRATYTTTLALYTAFADRAGWMRRLEALDDRRVISKDVYQRYETPEEGKNDHIAERLPYLRTNVRKIFGAGILVLAGTDTGVGGVLLGVSSQMELVLLVEAGLTPQEALQTATINAAKMLGREKDLGTVETGKLADLIMLDADPLADIRHIREIHRVIKGGVIYDPAQLFAMNR